MPVLQLKTVSSGNCSFLNPLQLLRLQSFFRSENVSSVLLGLPRDLRGRRARPRRRLAGVGRVIYRRGMGIPVSDTSLNRFLYGRVLTDLIVNSQDTRRAVLARNERLIPAERIHLLYNPVAPCEVVGGPSAPLIRRDPGELVIGNAGRLVEQKGQTHLLDAAAMLRDQGVRFVLAIAGEGPLRTELEARSRKLGLGDTVRFLGFVADMGPLLSGGGPAGFSFFVGGLCQRATGSHGREKARGRL